MKRFPLIISIALHLSLFGVSYLHFGNFLRASAIKDSGHTVFDFVTVGPKSKAPIISDQSGKGTAGKSKDKAKTGEKYSKPDKEQNNEIQGKPKSQTKPKPQANKPKVDKKKTDKPPQNNKSTQKPKNNQASTKPANKPKSSGADRALVNLDKKARTAINNLLDDALNGDGGGNNADEVGDTLTATQIDLVRQTIRKCWHFPAGLKDAESLIVDIKIELDREGYVQKAETIDKARKSKDPNFRVAAENAERAVLDPECNPLPLPKEKYEEWKNLELSFNPKDMM